MPPGCRASQTLFFCNLRCSGVASPLLQHPLAGGHPAALPAHAGGTSPAPVWEQPGQHSHTGRRQCRQCQETQARARTRRPARAAQPQPTLPATAGHTAASSWAARAQIPIYMRLFIFFKDVFGLGHVQSVFLLPHITGHHLPCARRCQPSCCFPAGLVTGWFWQQP